MLQVPENSTLSGVRIAGSGTRGGSGFFRAGPPVGAQRMSFGAQFHSLSQFCVF